jgi:hypothetical protein
MIAIIWHYFRGTADDSHIADVARRAADATRSVLAAARAA